MSLMAEVDRRVTENIHSEKKHTIVDVSIGFRSVIVIERFSNRVCREVAWMSGTVSFAVAIIMSGTT